MDFQIAIVEMYFAAIAIADQGIDRPREFLFIGAGAGEKIGGPIGILYLAGIVLRIDAFLDQLQRRQRLFVVFCGEQQRDQAGDRADERNLLVAPMVRFHPAQNDGAALARTVKNLRRQGGANAMPADELACVRFEFGQLDIVHRDHKVRQHLRLVVLILFEQRTRRRDKVWRPGPGLQHDRVFLVFIAQPDKASHTANGFSTGLADEPQPFVEADVLEQAMAHHLRQRGFAPPQAGFTLLDAALQFDAALHDQRHDPDRGYGEHPIGPHAGDGDAFIRHQGPHPARSAWSSRRRQAINACLPNRLVSATTAE